MNSKDKPRPFPNSWTEVAVINLDHILSWDWKDTFLRNILVGLGLTLSKWLKCSDNHLFENHQFNPLLLFPKYLSKSAWYWIILWHYIYIFLCTCLIWKGFEDHRWKILKNTFLDILSILSPCYHFLKVTW